MNSIVINPKSSEEAKRVTELLEQMNIASKVITDEEKEDLGLLLMMTQSDRAEKVSRDEIMNSLKS